MKKFLAIFCFLALNFTQIYAQDKAQEIESTDIVSVINQIDDINAQILLLKANIADRNDTAANSLLSGVEAKKSKLMEQIPLLIMQIEVTDSQIAEFKKKKSRLETNVARLKTSSNKNSYMQNALELEKMRLDELFYGTLLQLEELIKSGARAAKIRTALDESLLNLQTNAYANIKELKDGVEDTNLLDTYKTQISTLDLYQKTYEEILSYIRANADLLSSSYYLSELNLKTAIEAINTKIPFSMQGVNFGKIVIILVVFVFFISFTTILSKITYWLLAKFFAKSAEDIYTRDKIIKTIKPPMLLILTLYGIDMCMAVAYYPSPMPIKFANIVTILLVIAFTWLILRVISGYGMILVSEFTKKTGRKEVINMILKIVYFFIVVIAVLIVLSRLGFNISAIIASLGIGGLAVALATKDILANFFSSVMLLFDNSFSQGDSIVCGGIEGTVVEIGLRKTTIRTFDNSLIFVPNSKLASEPIINWSRRRLGRIIKMTVGLEYSSTAAQVKKCAQDIKEMLIAHEGIAKESDLGSKSSKYRRSIVSFDDMAGYKSNLYVNIDALSDSSIDISVYCFTKTILKSEYLLIKEDIILKIMDIVEANGLSFAFPSQSLYIEKFENKI